MVDNRRVKRRRTNSHGSNSMHSSSVDVATSLTPKRETPTRKDTSFRRLRKRDPSDPTSPSREDEQSPTDSGEESDPEPSSVSRSAKRKLDHPASVKTRSHVRSTEPFKFFHRLAVELYDHEDADEFQMPVLKKYDPADVPGYLETVSNPMDLGTVKKNITSDVYVEKSEDGGFYFDEAKCLSDIRLVFRNCMAYNMENSSLYEAADDFLKLIDTRLQQRSAAAAQRAAKVQQVKRAKAKKEAERRKRNASEPKAHTPSGPTARPSVGLETAQHIPPDSERYQHGNGVRIGSESNTQLHKEDREGMQNGLPHMENRTSRPPETALHVSSSNIPLPGTFSQLPQHFAGPINVPASMAQQSSYHLLSSQGFPQMAPQRVLQAFAHRVAPQIDPSVALATQSQDRLQYFPHPVSQGAGYVIDQHQLPMLQQNFMGAQANGSSLARPNLNMAPAMFRGNVMPAATPRMMQQIAPNNLTGLVQINGAQVVAPNAVSNPGMPSVPGYYGTPGFDASLPAAPYTANGIFDRSQIAHPGLNVSSVAGIVPAEAARDDDGEVNGGGEDSDDDRKANSSGASSEDEDEEDSDPQGGDISFSFVSTEGMEKKRGRKSVRVMELEGQHDSLMKRRKMMLELSAELEKRRQLQMTYLEKKKLCEEAAALDYVRMKGVVDILARGMSRPDFNNEVELDLDVDTVDNSVLREIQYFLKNPAGMTARESVTQVEAQISEIEQELVDLRYQKMSSSVRE